MKIETAGVTIEVTAKALGERTGMEYAEANTMLRFLEKQGHAKKAGMTENAGGRGRGAVIFALPSKITFDFG